MTSLPSISSVKRVEECPGSHVIKVTCNESGDAADKGTVGHSYVQAMGEGASQKEALAKVPAEYHRWCKRIDWEKIVSPLVHNRRAEVSYALDLETEIVRELGVNIGRRYQNLSPMDAYGTLDWEGQQEDGVWCYHEVKTGLHVGVPEVNWQARFFAAILMYKHGVDRVWVRIFYIRDDGEVGDPDKFLFKLEHVSGVVPDLIRIRNSIAKAQLDYDAHGKLEVTPGEHCRFCPGQLSCPVQYGRIGALVRELPEVAKIPVEQMDLHEIVRAWEIVDTLGFELKKVKTSLNRIIGSQGLDLPDGSKVRMVERRAYDVSADRLMRLARQYGATEEELAECSTDYKFSYPRSFPPPKQKKTA